jgi:protein TonB
VRLSQTLKEIGVVDKGSVNIRPVEKPGKRETEPASVLQAANDHDAAAAAAVHSPFARMAMNPPAVLKSDFDRTVAAADTSETSRRAPVFSLAARKSARNLQMSIVAGACLFLLAGAGIIYFTGMMGSTPSGAGKAAPATAQPAPAKVEAPAAPQSLPIAAVASKTSPVRPLRTVDSASTAAATSNSSSRNPAPTKESKPAVTEPQEAPATTKAGSTSTPPAAAAAAEKGTVLTVSAAENSSGVLPVGATTEIPLPPTILPQALSGSTLTQSVRNAAPSLEGLAVIDSAKTPLAPAPRDVVPAAVLSRVMPVYPDLARRTRTTGTVVVEVQIDEKGKVVKAIPESGPMILRAEAVNAVMQWRFKPATLGGNVIPSTSKVSIVFTGPK